MFYYSQQHKIIIYPKHTELRKLATIGTEKYNNVMC